jgi:hypothetical protein
MFKGFTKFMKRLWGGAVRLAINILKAAESCISAVAGAMGISSVMQTINPDVSLGRASRAVATHVFTQSQLTALGSATQVCAGKLGAAASYCHLTNISLFCAKVCAASSLAIGTTVASASVCVLFVGALWLFKRIVKRLSKDTAEFIEKVPELKSAVDLAEDLAAA